MRYQVPQFTEVEDKIFGPLSLKQFIYLAGGAGTVFILYVLLPVWLMVIPAIVVLAFVSALAFYKVNNRSFLMLVESFLNFHAGSKIYVWKKEKKKPKKVVEKKREIGSDFYMPKLKKDKLKELSWSLDTKEKAK